MEIDRRRPSGALRAVVRGYSERRAALGTGIVTAPLPARPDQFIEFYLADRYRVSHDDGPAGEAPEVVVVGPQSYRRTRLLMAGDIRVFTIAFQPGGFHALFGVPMTQLADEGAPIGDVLGRSARGLREDVLAAPDFDARIATAERWLASRLAIAAPPDGVGRLAAMVLRTGGQVRIDRLARRAGLSDRQFTRRFAAQVGLAPKLFARTVRFNAVMAQRAAAPARSWAELAHAAGYADQAHFVRDCRALAGAPPGDFFAEWLPGR